MAEKYVPNIEEASIPEEGSWVEIGSEHALVLSIPEWREILEISTEGYRYVWMYDRVEKAYLFCFRLGDGVDRAIAFPHDHAGMLLQDPYAQNEFNLAITAGELEKEGSFLYLKSIRFKNHPQMNK